VPSICCCMAALLPAFTLLILPVTFHTVPVVAQCCKWTVGKQTVAAQHCLHSASHFWVPLDPWPQSAVAALGTFRLLCVVRDSDG
jgi:hypothetical protein